MSVASYWDEKYIKMEDIWGWWPSPHLEELIIFLKSNNVKNVLELGSGYGRDIIELAKAGFKCTGLDPSETASNMAKKRAEAEKASVRLITGDIFDLPDNSEAFDAVTIVNILHLLDPKTRKEMFSRLSGFIKPGGYFSTVFLSVNDPVEYGNGTPVMEHAFEQKDGRIFYFFDENMARSVLPKDKFNILELSEYKYTELRKEGPPHHHLMWKLLAKRR